MIGRAGIYTALFALLQTATGFAEYGARLKFPAEVPAQPALFLRRTDDDYQTRRARGLPAIVVLTAEVIIYYRATDVEEAPGAELDALIEAVEAALLPGPLCDYQTLGGLVSHCWIEGTIKKDDGALSGQAGAIIPIKMLTTS